MISTRHLFAALVLGISLLLPFEADAVDTYPNCNPMTSSPCNMPEGQADFCATANTVNDQKTACESMSGGTILTSEASTAGGMSCAANRTPCQVDGTKFCANGGASACNSAGGEVITNANPNPDPAPTPATNPTPSTNNDDPTPSGGSNSSNQEGALINPLGVSSIEGLLSALLSGVIQIGSILLILALVWVGFQFVFAQGQEEKIRDARKALLWTVIGGILLLGAEAISLVLKATVESL